MRPASVRLAEVSSDPVNGLLCFQHPLASWRVSFSLQSGVDEELIARAGELNLRVLPTETESDNRILRLSRADR
jgi:hypothetical protein